MEGGTDEELNTLSTEQLRLELQQERRMKEMLERSTFEMKNTVAELEKRLNNVDDEGNEWKTRYETQKELNRQLERQIYLLKEKAAYIRGNPADRLASIRSLDEMPTGALNQFLKQLEMEKISLENQLKDYILRMEQEAKAYHKVNDERRIYVAEILQVSQKLVANTTSQKQKTDITYGTKDNKLLKGVSNIPPNQNILNSRKGQNKHTPGVKNLPKIEK
ncbi:hypothetical protein NDU88_002469 [Pleurodeles waltl]|uniref:Coiled-coil domain-containing protein 169 n=1 Tax=Pleurodeles waltl TaxID=8319 RepID=A0AAV7NN89_PLEWA|nr:hypothetical protein NDU88_002469 [Pleurodeles waltl]